MKRMISRQFPTKHEFSSEIFNYLSDNKVWVESVYSDYDKDDNTVGISVEIDGDWKHDHLQADYLMYKYFSGDLKESGETDIQESDDDSYYSCHTYVIDNANKYFDTNLS
jgi:hypothetical protein